MARSSQEHDCCVNNELPPARAGGDSSPPPCRACWPRWLRTKGPGALAKHQHFSPPCAGRGSTPALLVTRLPSTPGCVQEVVREAQLPPREQRPQILSENRLAWGSGQWEHGVSPTLWTPTCPCQVVYSGNGCGTFLRYPLPNLSNNPTEKGERAPERLHLPEAEASASKRPHVRSQHF